MKLVILGENWTVIFKDKVFDENGKEVAGLCDMVEKHLEIGVAIGKSKKAKIQEASRIIYHEFLHAVFHESDMRDMSWFNDDAEHSIISPVAKALAKNFPFQITKD